MFNLFFLLLITSLLRSLQSYSNKFELDVNSHLRQQKLIRILLKMCYTFLEFFYKIHRNAERGSLFFVATWGFFTVPNFRGVCSVRGSDDNDDRYGICHLIAGVRGNIFLSFKTYLYACLRICDQYVRSVETGCILNLSNSILTITAVISQSCNYRRE